MRRLLLGAVLVLVLAVTAVGHAATLKVSAASQLTFTAGERCTDDAVPVTHGEIVGGTATHVEVTVPSGCHGVAALIRLVGVPGATDLPFTFPTSGTTATVPVPGDFPADDVTGVAMTLGTWGVSTAWSYAPPETSSAVSCHPVDPDVDATCAVVVTGLNDWGSGYRLSFSVTTASSTPFEWEVRLDLSVTGDLQPGGTELFPGYPVPAGGWYDAWYPTDFSQSNLCAVSTSDDLPVLRLRGPYEWNSTVRAGHPAQSMGIQTQASDGGSPPEAFACD